MAITYLTEIAEMKGPADSLYIQRASTQPNLGHRPLVGRISPFSLTFLSSSVSPTLTPSPFFFPLCPAHPPSFPISLPTHQYTPLLFPIPCLFRFCFFFLSRTCIFFRFSGFVTSLESFLYSESCLISNT